MTSSELKIKLDMSDDPAAFAKDLACMTILSCKPKMSLNWGIAVSDGSVVVVDRNGRVCNDKEYDSCVSAGRLIHVPADKPVFTLKLPPVRKIKSIAKGVDNEDNSTGIDLVMPDTVTDVMPLAFAFYDFNSIVFSKKLKTVHENAFTGSTVKSPLVLPDGLLHIKSGAFYNTDSANARQIVIPRSVATIAQSALYGCEALFKGWKVKDVKQIANFPFGASKIVADDMVVTLT